MNIEQLIQERCPNGVEWKTLGEVCDISRGKVFSKKYIEDNTGEYPVYSSQTANNGELGKINSYMYDGTYLTWTTDGAYAGTIFKREGKFSITNVCGLLKIKDSNLIDIDFLYHWLSLTAKNYVYAGMGNPKLMSNQVAAITIPLPPLEIQSAIADILDKFTALTAELEAELEGRKKQYDFYRNRLLSFDYRSDSNLPDEEREAPYGGGQSNVRWVRLGDCIKSLNTGLNPRNFFRLNTEDATNYYVTIREIKNGKIICTDKTDRINAEALRLCNNRSNLEIGDVLFSGTGTIGQTAVIKEAPNNWNIKEGVYALKPDITIVIPSFLKYVLDSQKVKDTYLSKVAGGTVKSIPMKDLKQISIPLPPLAEQERIVKILDKFDALTSDLTQGLPAEIEARRQQYEYYREKLLSF